MHLPPWPAQCPGQSCRADLQRRGYLDECLVDQRADRLRLRGRDGRRRLADGPRSPCVTPRRIAGAGRPPASTAARHARNARGGRGRVPVVRGQRRRLPRDALAAARALDRTGSDFATGNVHRFDSRRTWPAAFLKRTFYRRRYRTHIASFRWLLSGGWRRTSCGGARSGRSTTCASRGRPARASGRAARPRLPRPLGRLVARPVYLYRERDNGEPSITQRRTELRTLRDRMAAIEHVRSFLVSHGRPARGAGTTRAWSRRTCATLDALPEGDDDYRAVPRRGGRVPRARGDRRGAAPARDPASGSGIWCAAAGCRSCSRSCVSRRPPRTGGRRRRSAAASTATTPLRDPEPAARARSTGSTRRRRARQVMRRVRPTRPAARSAPEQLHEPTEQPGGPARRGSSGVALGREARDEDRLLSRVLADAGGTMADAEA